MGWIPEECPECGSRVFDNRDDKRTANSPDWRCSNQRCTDDKGRRTAGWEKGDEGQQDARPRGGAGRGNGRGSSARPVHGGRGNGRGQEAPRERDDYGDGRPASGKASGGGYGPLLRVPATWGNLGRVYARCFDLAARVTEKHDITDPAAVVAAAATLFIQANKDGLRVEKDADREGPPPARPGPMNASRPTVERPSRQADQRAEPVPAPVPSFEDFPESLEVEDDGLPF